MLSIGSLYIAHAEGQARLCADISLNGRGTTLWFGVEEAQADCLCPERSDAFVMALLPTALRGGYELVCQTPMSSRLHYQLENYLIPTLCAAGDVYRPVTITAPVSNEKLPNKGGVLTGFSGGVDSLHAIMTHGKDSPLPLTHLTVFNSGVFEGAAYRQAFRKACAKAREFADELGLETVFVDSNLYEVLPERYLDVVSFRLLACALALQKGFRVYLNASTYTLSAFHIDLHESESFAYLLIQSAQTETMTVYNAGVQTPRFQKTRELTEWAPAHRWLHFCIYGYAGENNCGHCKKCAREIATLYSFDALDRFGQVLDLPTVRKTLPQQLGLVLANRESPLYDDAAKLLERSGVSIPKAAYVYAEQFRKALDNLREESK